MVEKTIKEQKWVNYTKDLVESNNINIKTFPLRENLG